MTLDALKKQASRLAAYLGAKHRLNLKHASALEALAAVHGARNWQTLAAGADRDDEDVATAPAGGPLTLCWHADGRPQVTLSRASWLRHAVAFGDTAGDWLHANLAEAAHSGLAALLLTYSREALPAHVDRELLQVVEGNRLTAAALAELLTKPGLVVATVTEGDGWGALLREAVLLRRGSTGQPPLVVALPDLNNVTEQDLASVLPLAEQGRAYGVTLRSTARLPQFVLAKARGAAFLANMTHRVFLDAARDAAREELLARLEAAPAVCLSSDGCRF
jgi:hypothetical protein